MEPTLCSYCRSNPSNGSTGLYPICVGCEGQLANRKLGEFRVCKRCGQQVANTVVTCEVCHFTDLDLVEDIPLDEEPATKQFEAVQIVHWECVCGFTANDSRVLACAVCGKTPFEERSLWKRFHYGSRKPQLWTCLGCKFEYNSEAVCSKCSLPKGAPAPKEQIWTCINCTASNPNSTVRCSECSCGQMWSDYLIFRGIDVTPNGQQWTCKYCKWRTSVGQYECQGCKQVPKAVKKYLARVGATESWWSRNKPWS